MVPTTLTGIASAISRYPLFLMFRLGLMSLLAHGLVTGILVGFPNSPWTLVCTRLGNCCDKFIGCLPGLVVMGVGVALLLVAAVQLRRQGTTVHPDRMPTQLVTSGIYGLSRNPMYLAMLLLLLGEALLLGSWVAFIAPVMFFWLLDSQRIPTEEATVARHFGLAYQAYSHKVRRWL